MIILEFISFFKFTSLNLARSNVLTLRKGAVSSKPTLVTSPSIRIDANHRIKDVALLLLRDNQPRISIKTSSQFPIDINE